MPILCPTHPEVKCSTGTRYSFIHQLKNSTRGPSPATHPPAGQVPVPRLTLVTLESRYMSLALALPRHLVTHGRAIILGHSAVSVAVAGLAVTLGQCQGVTEEACGEEGRIEEAARISVWCPGSHKGRKQLSSLLASQDLFTQPLQPFIIMSCRAATQHPTASPERHWSQ